MDFLSHLILLLEVFLGQDSRQMLTGMFPPSFCCRDPSSLPCFPWKGKVKVVLLQAKSPAGGVFEKFISNLPPG